jgi:uncharacterized membrane protein YdjX (TVP38/TMEM64 family)
MVEALKGWIERLGAWGSFAFVTAYVAATVALVPASPLTVVAGAVFGLFKGVLIVSISSTAGAAAAFLVARHLLRDKVRRRLRQHPKFDAIDAAIGAQGWKVVAMLRLSPAVPFNLQNYLYGLTAIRFVPYLVTSWIAMLPGTFLYVYVGYLGRTGVESAVGADRSVRTAEWILRIVGFAATVAVTAYVTRLARKALKTSPAISDPPATSGPMPGKAEGFEIHEKPPRQARNVPWRSLALFGGSIVLVAVSVWTSLRRDLVRSFIETNWLPRAAVANPETPQR